MNSDDLRRAQANIRNTAGAGRLSPSRPEPIVGRRCPIGSSAPLCRRRGLFDNKASCPACGGSCVATLEKPGRVTCSKSNAPTRTLSIPTAARDRRIRRPDSVYFVGLWNSTAVDRLTDGAADLLHAYALARTRAMRTP